METSLNAEDPTSPMETPLGDTGRDTTTDQEACSDAVSSCALFLLSSDALAAFTQLLGDTAQPSLPPLFDCTADSYIQQVLLGLWYTNAGNANAVCTRHIALKIYEDARAKGEAREREQNEGELYRRDCLYDTPSIPSCIKAEAVEATMSFAIFAKGSWADDNIDTLHHKGKRWWILTRAHGEGILAFMPYKRRKAGKHFFHEIHHGRQPRFRFQEENEKWIEFDWKEKTEEQIADLLTPVPDRACADQRETPAVPSPDM
ncbi:hypothetical protein FANTH_14900 [Fusarium anthophilum]|uniref:Uncharacterized protein n=1 Tax=Fusarium anthophilum TaxID=48485 RepID=A0A8H4YFJ3_9HYPO|nr:hypothetical protein FANTH_14900 [Fusarium anthophilum]